MFYSGASWINMCLPMLGALGVGGFVIFLFSRLFKRGKAEQEVKMPGTALVVPNKPTSKANAPRSGQSVLTAGEAEALNVSFRATPDPINVNLRHEDQQIPAQTGSRPSWLYGNKPPALGQSSTPPTTEPTEVKSKRGLLGRGKQPPALKDGGNKHPKNSNR